MVTHRHHQNGPGLRVTNPENRTPWWGPGYCGICGTRDENILIPKAVRWYDPDDGWRMGILCGDCGEEASSRGPEAGDFAVVTGKVEMQALRIDANSLLGDEDGTYSDQ